MKLIYNYPQVWSYIFLGYTVLRYWERGILFISTGVDSVRVQYYITYGGTPKHMKSIANKAYRVYRLKY
jgi:hypothetical protein